MRRGFTLIEVLLASSLSVMLFAALFHTFFSVWALMKESTEELQLTLHARMMRERLLYKLDEAHAGLFWCMINPKSGVNEDSGISVLIERKHEGSAQSANSIFDVFEIPGTFKKVENAKPTSGFISKVYKNEFLPGAAEVLEDSLFRMNLRYPSNGKFDEKTRCVYEDHIIVWVDGGVTWK